jgi:uridylate kinase
VADNCMPEYKRVLLKLSGEALAGAGKNILNYDVVSKICADIKKCHDMGVEMAVIVGAGNIWRGRQGEKMDRTRADHMGMLATVINSLALQDALEQLGLEVRVMTAIEMKEFAEPYIRNRAVHHLELGRIVIFGCGIGNPFFSTDTAAVMRAAEIGADIVMLAKNVDGVYDCDPHKYAAARKFDTVDYMYILSHELAVIDSTAASFSKDNNIPLLIFGLDDHENIVKAVTGEKIGTMVKPISDEQIKLM